MIGTLILKVLLFEKHRNDENGVLSIADALNFVLGYF
jgi:hypothetical protein